MELINSCPNCIQLLSCWIEMWGSFSKTVPQAQLKARGQPFVGRFKIIPPNQAMLMYKSWKYLLWKLLEHCKFFNCSDRNLPPSIFECSSKIYNLASNALIFTVSSIDLSTLKLYWLGYWPWRLSLFLQPFRPVKQSKETGLCEFGFTGSKYVPTFFNYHICCFPRKICHLCLFETISNKVASSEEKLSSSSMSARIYNFSFILLLKITRSVDSNRLLLNQQSSSHPLFLMAKDRVEDCSFWLMIL